MNDCPLCVLMKLIESAPKRRDWPPTASDGSQAVQFKHCVLPVFSKPVTREG